jgi:hypothetical protein
MIFNLYLRVTFMKIFRCVFVLLMVTVMGQATTAYGQGATASPLSETGSADFGESKSALGMNPEQARRISNYIYSAEAMNRTSLNKAVSKEELLARATELLTVLKISCIPTAVELAGESTDTANGKSFQNKLYEISCTDGLGYFLSSRDPIKKAGAKPDRPTSATAFALSCLSADKVHDDDVQKGINSEFYCHLANNGGGDMKMVTERLLASLGISCKVSQSKWFGTKQQLKTELTEVACDNGTGYLLQTPLPAGDAKPSAMNCNDAVHNGLECRMTATIKPVTLATFKEYLAGSKIDCKIDNYDQINLIGRENIKQRYVVEFKCAQQPKGLVAFIPLEGNPNVFETKNCKEMLSFGVKCKLTASD